MPSGDTITIPLLNSPQTQHSFGSCSYLDGQPSCCNSSSFSQIKIDTNEYDYEIEVKIAMVEAITPAQIVDEVVKCYNWTINSKQYDLAVQLATIFKSLLQPAVQCYGGYLGYFQGMLCFSCNPNWSTYYDSLQRILSLTSSTCDGVYQACQSLETNLHNAILQGIPILIQILQADDYPNLTLIYELQTILKAIKQGSVCQIVAHMSCKDLLCQRALRGLQPWTTSPNTTDQCVPLSSTLGFDFVTESLKVIKRVNSKLTAELPSSADMGVVNHYSSQGYDAYSVGCQPSLSTYACPNVSTPKKFDWQMIVMIGAPTLVGIVILSIIVIVCRRKRAAEAVALDDNLPKFERLIESEGQDSSEHSSASPYVPAPTYPSGQTGAIQ